MRPEYPTDTNNELTHVRKAIRDQTEEEEDVDFEELVELFEE